MRRGLPRFGEDNLAANLAIVDALRAIADRRGVTAGQLALFRSIIANNAGTGIAARRLSRRGVGA